MTDRELRLVRARVRLADAALLLGRAALDLYGVRDDLFETVERRRSSLLWACGELTRELAKGGAK